jgi:hypothetical protein
MRNPYNFSIINGSRDEEEWQAVKQAMKTIKPRAVRNLLVHILLVSADKDNKRIQAKHILEACAAQVQK